MSHPLRAAFEKARAENRAALVVYLMAGDPSLEATVELVPRLFEAGADVVELGLPFSDPMADGPVIQAAAMRSLAAGTSTARALDAARRIRERCDGTFVFMGYLNPLLSYGVERFGRDAAAAGASGVILPDLPADEAEEIAAQLSAHGIALVPLIAPTTSPERMAQIAKHAEGFVYYVSVTGVTGARTALPEDLSQRVSKARDAVSPAPLAVGFGVSKPEQARALGAVSDGVVVGSAVVRALAEQGPDAVVELVRSLRAGLNG